MTNFGGSICFLPKERKKKDTCSPKNYKVQVFLARSWRNVNLDIKLGTNEVRPPEEARNKL